MGSVDPTLHEGEAPPVRDPVPAADRGGAVVESGERPLTVDTPPTIAAAVSLPATLQRGDSLGRYVILDALGAGGMGTVYTARDPDLDRTIAIKLLHDNLEESRLVREAKALAKLSHPNVIHVYDVGTFRGRVFVAMEYVDGVTLRGWLRERKRPWRDVLVVFVDAAKGLAAAHAAGIVHRDFKPDNVLLGKDARVRVLDFGLAAAPGTRSRERSEPAPGGRDHSSEAAYDDPTAVPLDEFVTRPGTLVGTPAYMAPEQHRAEEVDARTDQWSFCVALWEALCDRRPFGGSTLPALTRAVLGGERSDFVGDAPAWLQRVLERGLSVDPSARWASMAVLLAEIQAGIASSDASAGMIGRRYEVIRVVSEPGLSDAHRAVDRLTGGVVTVERFSGLSSLGGERARVDLARGLSTLTSLRHPHLVGVLDWGFEGEQAHLALDLREPARDFVVGARDKSPSVQVQMLVQLLGALSYLHWRGFSHGAIGPETALVVEGQAKLLVTRAHPIAGAPGSDTPPAIAEDLRAIGRLAFDLFSEPEPGAASRRVRRFRPDVDPRIAAAIERMASDDPRVRPASASAAAAQLAETLGRGVVVDTVETRESFLSAARLVGRDAELSRLESALHAAIGGQGSAWLIGGESGVGKSRLVGELRTLGRVHGALVLRGQEETEAGSPYRLWREALRWMALVTDIGELEASVLLSIVPDLATILDRPVAPAPDLDPVAMHARLVEVVVSVFRRQARPIVLVLEDLHWSRSDSLKVLRAVVPLVAELPLLVVATYRDDERRDLPSALPGMSALSLGRLSGAAIAELATSMIGEAGARTDVVELLRVETEGNAFFLVEVVRALAEEAGTLEGIGTMELPDRVLSGGIRRVIKRRLERVPPPARGLLRLAAVGGRHLDLAVLRALAPRTDLDEWLTQCSHAAVLERDADVWRFSHDKLRDGVLLDLVDEERATLHRRVAEAIAETYPDDAARAAALAHHWGAAGESAKEATYAALSGEQALQNGAFAEALALFERALAIRERAGAPDVERATLVRHMAEASYLLGDYAAATAHLSRAHVLLGRPLPTDRTGWVVLLVWQILVQLAHLVRKPSEPEGDESETARLLETSLATGQLANLLLHQRDTLAMMTASLHSVNLAEAAGSTDARSVGLLGYSAGCSRLHGLAVRYFAEGRAAARDDADGAQALHSLLRMEGLYLMGIGEIDRSDAPFQEGLEIATRIGYALGASESEGLLAMSDYFRGRFESMLVRFRSCVARFSGASSRHALGFVCGEALALAMLGRLDEALDLLQSVRGDVAPDDHLGRAFLFSELALVHARRGDSALAVEDAAAAMTHVRSSADIPACSPQVLLGVAEAHLARWRADGATSGSAESAARRHLSTMQSWARLYPVGRPLTLLVAGRIEALAGRPGAARRAWERALPMAERWSMAWIQQELRAELK